VQLVVVELTQLAQYSPQVAKSSALYLAITKIQSSKPAELQKLTALVPDLHLPVVVKHVLTPTV
jgi:predicted DNA-binding transcriptional regulator YafY